jgi:glutaredoxin 3
MQRSAPIVLFVIYGCPYCKAAKKLCQHLGIPNKAINIGNNAKLMTDLARKTGSPTVPKVFIQGRFIGGFDQLNQIAQNGQLESLLQQPMV